MTSWPPSSERQGMETGTRYPLVLFVFPVVVVKMFEREKKQLLTCGFHLLHTHTHTEDDGGGYDITGSKGQPPRLLFSI